MFVIKKGSTGKFRFSLVTTNGQIVATSEAYKSKASGMNGIRCAEAGGGCGQGPRRTGSDSAGPSPWPVVLADAGAC